MPADRAVVDELTSNQLVQGFTERVDPVAYGERLARSLNCFQDERVDAALRGAVGVGQHDRVVFQADVSGQHQFGQFGGGECAREVLVTDYRLARKWIMEDEEHPVDQ